MSLRLSIIIVALAIGAVGYWGFVSEPDESGRSFEAHEFAMFNSEYETLKLQSAAKRVEHFRILFDTTEAARLTPSMVETLADFCRTVATSEEEVTTVQAEAKRVLRVLETKMSGRVPAAAEAHK